MWPIIGIILVAIGMVLYEVPSMLNKKLTKELWVFSILLIFGVIFGIIESFDVEIPNPADLLTIIYKPLTDLIFSVLE